MLYFLASSSFAFIISHIFSTRSKLVSIFNKSSKLGIFPLFILGYISFNIIEIFSNAWIIKSSLYASSLSKCVLAYIPFNTDEIVIAIFDASSYINGFNPIEFIFDGSIKLYLIW